MSIQSVNEFRNKVKGNAELENELRGLVGTDGALDMPAAIKLGEQHGYTISADDIVAVFANDDEELSDFELEMVSAGASVSCGSDGA